MVLHSAFTCWLIKQLCPWKNSLYDSLIKRTHIMMKRREFFKRMGAMANNQIHHPIFFKKSLFFAQFAQIWRANLIGSMVSSMRKNETVPFSPTKVKVNIELFTSLFSSEKDFTVKFECENGSTIVMKFQPNKSDGCDGMLLTVLFLDGKGHSKKIESLPVKMIQPKCGVELRLHHDNELLFWFFYTQRLYTPRMLMGLFGMDNFRITTVTFYKEPDVMYVLQNPKTLVSKPTKRPAGYILQQSFAKIPKESDGSFSKPMNIL